jgi:hypothetical protein
MEVLQAGLTLESSDQPDQIDVRAAEQVLLEPVASEPSAEVERQESMFGGVGFDDTEPSSTDFDDGTSFEASATTGYAEDAVVEDVVFEDAAEEFSDSLPLEAPDEAAYAQADQVELLQAEAVSVEEQAQKESSHAPEEDAGPAKILTVDDFAALEERVLKAVSLVRREREARVAAEERLLLVESQMLAQAPTVEQLHQEIESLRTEREQVRLRVERLLSQLDALEL